MSLMSATVADGRLMSVTPSDLTGIWLMFGDSVDPDHRLAKEKGHDDGSRTAPHGTFTPLQHFVVRMGSRGKDDQGKDQQFRVLDIFNDKGEFSRFVWNGTGAWVSENPPTGVTFSLPASDKDDAYAPKGASLVRYPTLVLSKHDSVTCPSNAEVGDRFVRSLGDGTVAQAIAPQRITYDARSKTFRWRSDADPGGLDFQRFYPQRRDARVTGPDSFGDTFKGHDEFAQAAFPFYGFDPRRMNIYATGPRETSREGPGTPRTAYYKSNPQQSFNGTLIFNFPRHDSADYARAVDVKDTPFLPLGVSGLNGWIEEGHTHAELISTVADMARSWSLTLGLSGGTEKMMTKADASTSEKVKEQREGQCRYTVARKVGKSFIAHTDLAQMSLHEDFVGAIQSLTAALLTGDTPEWERFVKRFGTHYAHAITQGRIDLVETRFSMQAEVEAVSRQTKVNLDVAAKEIPGGVPGAGGGIAYSNEYSKKHKLTVSQEDIFSWSIGHETPMGIFYDLRPITELLSLLFFPYEPGDPEDWGKVTPWVWYGLRPSLAKYLEGLGVNQPLEKDAFEDYAPWRYKLTLETIQVTLPPQPGANQCDVYLGYAQIDVGPAWPEDKRALRPDISRFVLVPKMWTRGGWPNIGRKDRVSQGIHPPPGEASWEMVVRGPQKSFPISLSVTVQAWTAKSNVEFKFDREVMVDATELTGDQLEFERAAKGEIVLRGGEVTETKSGYLLVLKFGVEDLGPFA
jgi:hypothetical protein